MTDSSIPDGSGHTVQGHITQRCITIACCHIVHGLISQTGICKRRINDARWNIPYPETQRSVIKGTQEIGGSNIIVASYFPGCRI